MRNFNWNGQHIDAIVKLSDCQLEIFQKNRHYVMKNVNARFDIDTNRAIRMNLTTGKFGRHRHWGWPHIGRPYRSKRCA